MFLFLFFPHAVNRPGLFSINVLAHLLWFFTYKRPIIKAVGGRDTGKEKGSVSTYLLFVSK